MLPCHCAHKYMKGKYVASDTPSVVCSGLWAPSVEDEQVETAGLVLRGSVVSSSVFPGRPERY